MGFAAECVITTPLRLPVLPLGQAALDLQKAASALGLAALVLINADWMFCFCSSLIGLTLGLSIQAHGKLSDLARWPAVLVLQLVTPALCLVILALCV